MTLTLLLDLDDTLLSNDFDTFLPAYLKALGKHMMDYVPPEKMVNNLLAATQVMVANGASAFSLERTFDQAFYPAVGRTKEELRAVLEQFYDEVFPSLQHLTSQRPDAHALIDYSIQRGHTLVVATNPLFPRKAISHRLRWAGLEETPFALITAYERFHFAKPNPAYFAEILAQLGWPNQPAVVVGNSLTDDLIPAAKLGLPVYWVTDQLLPFPDDFHPLSDGGALSGVPAWIEKVEAANLKQTFSTPEALLAVLLSTPAMFDTLSTGLTERQWRERPEPDEWSLTEIFCHLRDVDREVNIPRLEKILTEKNPFLAGVNSDSWAEERQYAQQDGLQALADFITARTHLVNRFRELSEDDWQMPARHAIFGPTKILELASFTATHDRSHIQQSLSVVNQLAS